MSTMQDIGEALEMESTILQAVLSKALQAQRAAEAAKKARELVRRKSVLSKSTLPGKLSDCSSTDRAISEIFLVEGDSAGGLLVVYLWDCLHVGLGLTLLLWQAAAQRWPGTGSSKPSCRCVARF